MAMVLNSYSRKKTCQDHNSYFQQVYLCNFTLDQLEWTKNPENIIVDVISLPHMYDHVEGITGFKNLPTWGFPCAQLRKNAINSIDYNSSCCESNSCYVYLF